MRQQKNVQIVQIVPAAATFSSADSAKPQRRSEPIELDSHQRDPEVGRSQPGPSWGSHEFRSGDTWAPAVNVYQYGHGLVLCMELAGVDKATVDVQVQPGKLLIRGQRQPPYQPEAGGEPLRILTMEIEHGRFVRTMVLPEQIEISKVTSHYRDGLLWVELPFEQED